MATAFLPAQLLHVAAQFASIDDAKQTMTGILVRPAEGGGIQIDSVDGHRAFSVTCPDPTWECEEPMLLSAKAFKKRIPHAVAAQLKNVNTVICGAPVDCTARILGGKTRDGMLDTASDKGLAFMQSISALWQPAYAFVGDPAERYPKVDQIWPIQFGNDTETPINFNAALLADFLAEVKRYSTNDLVTMQRNGAHNPAVFTAKMSGAWLDEVEMRFLLMPVEIGGAAARAS